MIQKPNILCVRDAAHARKMLQNCAAEAPLILLCVRPEQEEPWVLARLAETLYRTAQAHGAELALLFSNKPVLAAAQFIRQRGARQVVIDAMQETTAGLPEILRRWMPRVKIVMQTDGNAEAAYVQDKYRVCTITQ